MPVYSTTCSSGMDGRPDVRSSAAPAPETTHETAHAMSQHEAAFDRDQILPPTFDPHDPHGPDGAGCALRPTGASSKVAREFTTTTLRSWDLPELIDDAVVIVSELVTNAVRHGLPAYAAASGDRPIRLTLVRQGRFVVFVVSDPSDQDPQVRAADDVCENGRGLHVIEALSRVWGWTPLPGTGKAVWAALAIR
jgi:anti-sigma regulatory factor (Ser/Thr protein kinase)